MLNDSNVDKKEESNSRRGHSYRLKDYKTQGGTLNDLADYASVTRMRTTPKESLLPLLESRHDGSRRHIYVDL